MRSTTEMWPNMKNKYRNQFKYLSLVLVLSFFLVHNILLVITGIVLALIEINKNNDKQKVDETKEYKSYEIECENIDPNKENKSLTLVEKIEELGFIPLPERFQ
mgnify:FL=1